MTDTPFPQVSLPPEQAWAATLQQLQLQMTRDTFDTWLKGTAIHAATNGTWQVAVSNEYAADWLTNRLRDTIVRTVETVVGQPVTIEFVVSPPADTDAPENEAIEDPIVREVADPDVLLAAYLESGGSGYAQVPHLYTRYWMPLLGPAYDLWLSLTGDDKRNLRAIAPDFWTPARRYSYKELAARLNQQNPRCIYGYADECHRSRQRRLVEQRPLTAPADCCRNARWSHLRQRSLPEGGYLCEHWVPGRLEVLHRHGLVRVQLAGPTSRKPSLQLWRLLPPLTPHQVKSYLTPSLQNDYQRFISEYGHLFRLDLARWQQLTVPSLLPLLPKYQAAGSDNFEQRQNRQTFLAEAAPNPQYLTCMSDIDAATPP
jgi:hypothetical protein